MSYWEALEIADHFGKSEEVGYYIDRCGYTPEQALKEWNCV